MQTILQDMRYGARLLLKNPGFTLIAVLTLGLGIGANTAIFSVVNSVLLRPLNYPDSDRVLTIWENHQRREGPELEWASPPGFEDWRDQTSVFERVAAVSGWQPTLTEAGEPEMLVGATVSHDAFSVLGVNPMLGRECLGSEDRAGGGPVAVIGYGLWQRRFSGDASIVGKTIILSGESFTVIGVMPAGFRFPFVGDAEIWRTLQPTLRPRC